MKKILAIFLAMMGPLALPLSAQNFFQRFDSVMTEKYRKGDIDTAYIMRPSTKWTVKARFNLSGATIESEGIDNGQHFKSEMTADYKSTLIMGISYLGISLNTALNEPQCLLCLQRPTILLSRSILTELHPASFSRQLLAGSVRNGSASQAWPCITRNGVCVPSSCVYSESCTLRACRFVILAR